MTLTTVAHTGTVVDESVLPYAALLTEGRRNLDAQIASYRDADTRAIESAKIAGILLGVGAAGFGLLSGPGDVPLPRHVEALILAGLLTMLVAVALAAGALTASSISVGAAGYRQASRTRDLTDALVHEFLLEVYDTMIAENRAALARKTRFVDWSLATLILGLGLAAAGALTLSWAGA